MFPYDVVRKAYDPNDQAEAERDIGGIGYDTERCKPLLVVRHPAVFEGDEDDRSANRSPGWSDVSDSWSSASDSNAVEPSYTDTKQELDSPGRTDHSPDPIERHLMDTSLIRFDPRPVRVEFRESAPPASRTAREETIEWLRGRPKELRDVLEIVHRKTGSEIIMIDRFLVLVDEIRTRLDVKAVTDKRKIQLHDNRRHPVSRDPSLPFLYPDQEPEIPAPDIVMTAGEAPPAEIKCDETWESVIWGAEVRRGKTSDMDCYGDPKTWSVPRMLNHQVSPTRDAGREKICRVTAEPGRFAHRRGYISSTYR